MIEKLLNILTPIAHAQGALNFYKIDPTGGMEFANIYNSLINRIPFFLGGFALLALLYSGAIYIGAMGDPQKTEVAKKNITWVIIGVLASTAVVAIIIVLAKAFGSYKYG